MDSKWRILLFLAAFGMVWTACVPNSPESPLPANPTPTLFAPPVPPPTQPTGPTPCPIPSGWLPYVAEEGDDLDRLGQIYSLQATDLQRANCKPDDVVTAGDLIYVPGPGSAASAGGAVADVVPTSTPADQSSANAALGGANQSGAAPVAESTVTPTPLVETPVTPTSEAALFLDLPAELNFASGGGGVDLPDYECPAYDVADPPRADFGREPIWVPLGELCINGLVLQSGAEYEVQLIKPGGNVEAFTFVMAGDPAHGPVALEDQTGKYQITISDQGQPKSKLSVEVMAPPSAPIGNWQVQVNDGVQNLVNLSFVVPPITEPVMFAHWPAGDCCHSGGPLQYEGAGLTPNHMYILGGYLDSLIEAPEHGGLVFQAQVTTNAAGIFILSDQVPAVNARDRYCLSLLDPQTNTLFKDYRTRLVGDDSFQLEVAQTACLLIDP